MEFHRLAKEQQLWKLGLELLLLPVLLMVFAVLGVALYSNPPRGIETMTDVFVLAAVLPVPFLAARIMGRDPAALISVAKRVRWDIVGKSAAIAVPPYAIWLAINAADGEAQFTRFTLCLLVVYILVTPLQAATEELLFRASLPQILGARLRSPWLAYGIPMIPFIFLHIYNWLGLLDIVVFAACAAYLTWRTGGIEAAVVLHAANNIMVFGGEALHPNRPVLVEVSPQLAATSIAVTVAVTGLLALRLRPQQRLLPSPQPS
ncbi:CPBP family intramembrane metalloprotease [Corynebacterium aquatimens]|uniref:CPBP family intramembrane glutamic endopeptidase n=1 Tax=Corynebacterium TaxID=1716 RepID=UPI001F3E61C6|nr:MULTISPECIES: type II CAAX endopeptidase family protein [Corynebacterium]QYH19366.1 CPBP family intramembrane metalloprotease [Corynebacterium aquatimens]UIZ91725.1 CPBP family intramembrane metalloprotease [Corynebacterium sp. CNCTC7651]